MNKGITILVVLLAIVSTCGAATQVQSFNEVFITTSIYYNLEVEFDLTGKELVSDDYTTSGLDASKGISINNESYCTGTGPHGPALCYPNTYYMYDYIDGSTLVIGFSILTSSNPYAVTSVADFDVQISYTTLSQFDGASQSLTVELPNTVWTDIHYTINGGAQLNYRMVKEGDNFTQVVAQALSNGDVIEFYTTSYSDATGISESDWSSVTVTGIVDLLSTTIADQTITLNATQNLDWVDLHYTINGSSQYNIRMSGSLSEFAYTIPQTLVEGDVVTCSYTYALQGRAADSETETFSIPFDVTTLEGTLNCVESYVVSDRCDWFNWTDMYLTCKTYSHVQTDDRRDSYLIDEVKAERCVEANWPTIKATLLSK